MQSFAFKVIGAAAIIFTVTAVGTFYTAARVVEHFLPE